MAKVHPELIEALALYTGPIVRLRPGKPRSRKHVRKPDAISAEARNRQHTAQRKKPPPLRAEAV
jgi:hypothetical protein